MVDMIFPNQTNHYGTFYGGDALRIMGKAAFIASTRQARPVMVMAASDRIDFRSPIREGEMVELTAEVRMIGRSSVRISVDVSAEDLKSGERRHAAQLYSRWFRSMKMVEQSRSVALDSAGPSVPSKPSQKGRSIEILGHKPATPRGSGADFPEICSRLPFPEMLRRRRSFGKARAIENWRDRARCSQRVRGQEPRGDRISGGSAALFGWLHAATAASRRCQFCLMTIMSSLNSGNT